MTGLLGDGVGLSLVLGQTSVDRLNDVGTDGGLEDSRERGGVAAGLSVGADDRNSRSGRLGSIRQHLRSNLSQFRPNHVRRTAES